MHAQALSHVCEKYFRKRERGNTFENNLKKLKKTTLYGYKQRKKHYYNSQLRVGTIG